MKFHESVKNTITHRNVIFVGKHPFRAHFKDDFMLIKNQIGTMDIHFLIFTLRGGVLQKQQYIVAP